MKRRRQIWLLGWSFLFLHITVSSLLGPLTGLGSGKWGDSVYWVWLWFIANTLGIFIMLNFTQSRTARQPGLVFAVLFLHLALLYVSYFTAAFREIQLGNLYEPIRHLNISYSWLLPLQGLFIFLFWKHRKSMLAAEPLQPVEALPEERAALPIEISEAVLAQKEKWRKYIEDAEPEKAFEQVQTFLEANNGAIPQDIRNQFSNLKSRRAKLKRDVNLGHVDAEDAWREESKISFALLEFIDELSV